MKPLLAVVGWEAFQHYKDRNPPWIKLHKSVLDNYEFHSLPLASRAIAPMLWLLASEYSDPKLGLIDHNYEKLAFRLRCKPDEMEGAIKSLVENGFLKPYNDASKMLLTGKQVAVPETYSKESESEGEKETRAEISRTEADMFFCSFWEAFPLWAGKNGGCPSKGPRKKAQEKFYTLLKKEKDYEQFTRELISAAQCYKHYLEQNGWQSNCHAVVWLNQERWKDDYSVGYVAPSGGDNIHARALAEGVRRVMRSYDTQDGDESGEVQPISSDE